MPTGWIVVLIIVGVVVGVGLISIAWMACFSRLGKAVKNAEKVDKPTQRPTAAPPQEKETHP
eukprot:SAG31_NODE_3744_length_3929_cov_2.697911_3_plen_62_part_00